MSTGSWCSRWSSARAPACSPRAPRRPAWPWCRPRPWAQRSAWSTRGRGERAGDASAARHRGGTGELALLASWRAAQPGEDGEHAPAVVRVAGQTELGVDPRDVRLHRLHAQTGDRGDPLVRAALRHVPEDRLLPLREAVELAEVALVGEQVADELLVDDGLAVAHPLQRVLEDVRVGDAVLHEVPAARGAVLKQPAGVRGLRVLGQDQDADPRVAGGELVGEAQALVGERGRQANVED